MNLPSSVVAIENKLITRRVMFQLKYRRLQSYAGM